MNKDGYKFVDFSHCKKCKYEKVDENDINKPCYKCLESPVNLYSEIPINYKEKD